MSTKRASMNDSLMNESIDIADPENVNFEPGQEPLLTGSPEPQMDGKTTQYGLYAVEVEVPASEPGTRHWRHTSTQEHGLAVRPPILAKGDEATVSQCLKTAAEKYGAHKCMGTRQILTAKLSKSKGRTLQKWTKGPYVYKTFNEVFSEVQATAKGLLSLPGIEDKRRAKEEIIVALLAETSAEWMISAQGALAAGITITTVYATLGHEAMLHGLNQTQAEIIFVEWSLYEVLKTKVLGNCPALRHIIVIGEALVPAGLENGTWEELGYEQFPTSAAAEGMPPIGEAQTYTLGGIQDIGRKSEMSLKDFEPKTDDLALIMYTSGSTGVPKGVELTHRNFVSVVASVIAQGIVVPQPGDVGVAYLPLAHILELMVEVATMAQGGAIGYAHARTLTASSPYVPHDDHGSSDLLALQPTIMAAVPAILDMIKGGLLKKINDAGGLKATLFNNAVARKQHKPTPGGCCSCCSCLDNVILGKVKAALGLSNLRIMISGGAPLNATTQEFVNAVFCPVAQGYGATETSGCATVQECISANGREPDTAGGRVGAIQPASEIKLLDCAEMGYLTTDKEPRGEILIAGNNLARGYYKMPEKTAEDFVLHPDGKVWFHTGDIGLMCNDGVLKIIDRKKDLIKLTGGEYVSLGKVEAAMKQVQGVGACVVFAKSDMAYCVAVVSQPEKGWASVGGKPVESELLAAMKKELPKQECVKFEIPTKVFVDEEIWTPESGLVTAAFKVARNPLRNHYNGKGGALESMGYSFD